MPLCCMPVPVLVTGQPEALSTMFMQYFDGVGLTWMSMAMGTDQLPVINCKSIAGQ